MLTNLLVIAAVAVAVIAVAWFKENPPGPTSSADTARIDHAAVNASQKKLPRMIDLGADKCIPCIKMAPILAELKTEYDGKAEIEFIDVWKEPSAGREYGVRIIPTQIFYDQEGKEVWRHEGFLSKEEIVARLKDLEVG